MYRERKAREEKRGNSEGVMFLYAPHPEIYWRQGDGGVCSPDAVVGVGGTVCVAGKPLPH